MALSTLATTPFGATRWGQPTTCGADGNADGVINQGDYDIWKNNFGGGNFGSGSGGTTVPEPSVVVLLGSVLASLLGIKSADEQFKKLR